MIRCKIGALVYLKRDILWPTDKNKEHYTAGESMQDFPHAR